MTHAKFNFNQLMLTLIFDIRASEPPGPAERLKKPGLIGLKAKKTGDRLKYLFLNNENYDVCLPPYLWINKIQFDKKTNTRF